MPPIIKINESAPPVIAERYKIIREISSSFMAWAYEAIDLKKRHRRVFLKYYKSPVSKQSWYTEYIRYVKAINKRLRESEAASNCVIGTELFEANPRPNTGCKELFLFQAFDFIEGGYDLRGKMQEGIDARDRITMAKLFLQAMSTIHAAGIVHCDLKPENVQMLELKDPTVQLKWAPRIIDMDRSIIDGHEPPWRKTDEKNGYVGTPNYKSPEHLRGQTPTKGSDVFTVGIILGELLCGRHPFSDHIHKEDAYREAALHGHYKKMRPEASLRGRSEDIKRFCVLLNRCLHPDAEKRPTCTQLHQALLAADKAPTSVLLRLTGDRGECMVRISMPFGKYSLRKIDTAAERFSTSGEQFSLEYDQSRRQWFVLPPAKTPRNPTALNGHYLRVKTKLSHGDIISLKSKTSGQQAMLLKVSLIAQYD